MYQITVLCKTFNLKKTDPLITLQRGRVITAEEFFAVALESDTVADISEKLGVPYNSFRKTLKNQTSNIFKDRSPKHKWTKYLNAKLPQPKKPKKPVTEKLTTAEYNKQYYAKNKEKFRAKSAKYRAARIQRTPSWVDSKELEEIYKNCPQGHHVDHIIPLQGDLVSGLHVPANLQYLKAEDNIKKGNNYQVG